MDDIALPLENPWRRNVRPGDIQFLKDGTGVSVTLDGDVWLVRGLNETARQGALAAVRVRPARADDARDSRRADLRLRQQRHLAAARHQRRRRGRRPRAVLQRVRADRRHARIPEHDPARARRRVRHREGRSAGDDDRQAQRQRAARLRRRAACDECWATDSASRTSASTCAPASSPRAISRANTSRPRRCTSSSDRQFYGFLSRQAPREQYPAPIAEPLTWMPHADQRVGDVAGLAVRRRMGPLNDELVHIGFNKPELFRVCSTSAARKPQAAVVSITRAFEFPAAQRRGESRRTASSTSPASRFSAGATTARRLAGLGRVRYTGAPVTLPREVVPMDKGVLLRVRRRRSIRRRPPRILRTTRCRAGIPAHLQIWFAAVQGRRHAGQGSADAEQRLSLEGRPVVFIGVPEHEAVMQMRVGWSLATADGAKFEENAYFTPTSWRNSIRRRRDSATSRST